MKKIVIKIGTSSLTDHAGKLNYPWMVELARQVKQLQNQGHEIVIVSSGAIAAGRASLSHSIDQSLSSKQMLASVGQVSLMDTWSKIFGIYGVTIGQVLLAYRDLEDEKQAENTRNTLLALIQHKVIPIINENDTVATEEISFGDNDHLSALVASFIGADLLILLTDQEGLYTADPRYHAQAQLIQTVDNIDEALAQYAGSAAADGVGTGGMVTKVKAAKKATENGTQTVIASAKTKDVVLGIVAGEKIGSLFSV